jgi:hypothetical protein
MSDKTPTEQMRTPVPGESVLAYRVGMLEQSGVGLHKKVDRILEKMNEKNVDHELAVQRCGKWGKQIEAVYSDELPSIHRRIDSISSSASNAASSAKSDAQPVTTGRTWPDVFFNPATPIAFAALLLLVALVVIISAKTGRDVDTFIPHATGP